MNAESADFCAYQRPLGPTGSGPVCIQIDYTAGEVLQLEAGYRGRSHGCLQPGLNRAPGEGMCQPPMEPGGQGTDKSATTEGHTSNGCPSVEEPALVPSPAGDAGGLSDSPPTEEGPDQADTSGLGARNNVPAGRLAYLRKRYPPAPMTRFSGSGSSGVINGTRIPFRDL